MPTEFGERGCQVSVQARRCQHSPVPSPIFLLIIIITAESCWFIQFIAEDQLFVVAEYLFLGILYHLHSSASIIYVLSILAEYKDDRGNITRGTFADEDVTNKIWV